jgi:hypothetical protein
MRYLLFILVFISFSCNWAKEKVKSTVNKTGEVVAQTGAEFAQGVTKGVEKTYQNKVFISDLLKREGISTGKIIIHGTDTTTDNIVTAYLIFENNFNRDLTIKVFSETDQEYGRVTQNISGQKGEAKYFDFIFDKRTNIDSKGKLVFE